MIHHQGNRLSDDERFIILKLLKLDLSIPQIATRLGISRSAVSAFNKKFQVRIYNGKRDTWQMGPGAQSE